MDIETRPISDHHDQQATDPKRQHQLQACNQYHQLASDPSENSHHQQNIRPIGSQTSYFYQALDGSQQHKESHPDDLTRAQLVGVGQASISATRASLRTGKSIILESGESHGWHSSRNIQSNDEYSDQLHNHHPIRYIDSAHESHNRIATISQSRSLSSFSHPPQQPVSSSLVSPAQPAAQQPPISCYTNENPNEFYSTNNNHQLATDYNYALYQRNTWHLSSNGEAQFATRQHYNYYNYYDDQQQRQQQQQQHYHQHYQTGSLIQQQQEGKQQHNHYYNNNNHHHHHHHQPSHPTDEQLYDNPVSFLYADQYSRSSAINHASYEQTNTSGPHETRQQLNIDETSPYYIKQQTESSNDSKQATSIWSDNQVNNSLSSHVPTLVCPTKAHNEPSQEKSWIPASNQPQPQPQPQLQQQRQHQLKEQQSSGQEMVKKVTVVVGKTNLSRTGSNGTSSIQQTNQCSVCGRNYARPSTLKTHLRTHTNERPFKCNICFKTFSQAANLTAHLRVHTGKPTTS